LEYICEKLAEFFFVQNSLFLREIVMSSNPVYLGSKGALEGLGQTARAARAARNNKKH
jgi:hypothetical protein